MNNQYHVLYSPKAKEDLRDIYSYIAFTLKAPTAAEGQMNRIQEKIRSLDTMPLRFAAVEWEPWFSMKMRRMPIDNFVVFYTVDSTNFAVTIIRIAYGGRDIKSIASE